MPRRAARRLLVVALLVSAVVPLGSRPAWACRCAPSTLAQRGQHADAVFTGTVTRIENAPSDRVVNFDVDTVYKGEGSPSIDVHTGYGGGDCGVRFVVDRRYTVFGFHANGVLNTYSCDSPVAGDVDPAKLGLGPGITGLHRPLSAWLIVFTVLAGIAVVAAITLTARRRRAGQAK
jgi:hypothetical protein